MWHTCRLQCLSLIYSINLCVTDVIWWRMEITFILGTLRNNWEALISLLIPHTFYNFYSHVFGSKCWFFFLNIIGVNYCSFILYVEQLYKSIITNQTLFGFQFCFCPYHFCLFVPYILFYFSYEVVLSQIVLYTIWDLLVFLELSAGILGVFFFLFLFFLPCRCYYTNSPHM